MRWNERFITLYWTAYSTTKKNWLQWQHGKTNLKQNHKLLQSFSVRICSSIVTKLVFLFKLSVAYSLFWKAVSLTHTYSYMNRNESVEICLNDIFWLRTMPMLFEMCSTTNIRLKRPNSYSKLLEITIFLKQYLIFHSECHEISGKIASIQNSNDFRLKSMQ